MMHANFSSATSLRGLVPRKGQGWGLGKGRRLSPFSNKGTLRMFHSPVLRPVPGSRVSHTPAHTQGAGVPVSGSPVKGKDFGRIAVSVTAAHLQAIDTKAQKGGRCPNVAH